MSKKKDKNQLYFYYLPCLNPRMDISGGIVGHEEKVQVGDIFTSWSYPVEVIEAPDCKPSSIPNFNSVPCLKVKPINMSERKVPARIYV